MRNNLAALIPARAGSKRLPGKNVAMIGEKPMVEWSIIAARQSRIFDAIIVSTNDVRVRDVARKYSDVKIIEQPDFPQDDLAMERVVRSAFLRDFNASYMMLLQPTSPLRARYHIEEAWELFNGSFPVDSLVSVDPNRMVNGAIYIFTWGRIAKGKTIYDDDSLRYVMDAESSIDVDTQDDLDRARFVMDHGKTGSMKRGSES